MEHLKRFQRGNKLEVDYSVMINFSSTPSIPVEAQSIQLVLGGAVFVKLRVVYYYKHGCSYKIFNYVRFLKQFPEEDKNTYIIEMKCRDLGSSIISKKFTCDDGNWLLFHEFRGTVEKLSFSVEFKLSFSNKESFQSLYKDNELTDFELRGEGGAVRFHKAVLAATSPVFHHMLNSTWKETVEGHMKVTGTSINTLSNLKKYVYCNILPEEGLEKLLVLATYYDMPILEQECVNRLLQDLTEQNVCYYLEFAGQNKITRLVLGILDIMANQDLDCNRIRKHELYTKTKSEADDSDAQLDSNSA